MKKLLLIAVLMGTTQAFAASNPFELLRSGRNGELNTYAIRISEFDQNSIIKAVGKAEAACEQLVKDYGYGDKYSLDLTAEGRGVNVGQYKDNVPAEGSQEGYIVKGICKAFSRN